MYDLITYLTSKLLDLLISPYYAVAVALPIVLGLFEIVYILLRGRRRSKL